MTDSLNKTRELPFPLIVHWLSDSLSLLVKTPWSPSFPPHFPLPSLIHCLSLLSSLSLFLPLPLHLSLPSSFFPSLTSFLSLSPSLPPSLLTCLLLSLYINAVSLLEMAKWLDQEELRAWSSIHSSYGYWKKQRRPVPSNVELENNSALPTQLWGLGRTIRGPSK